MRLQDYSARPPTSKVDTSRKREPTPFAGNHVVDVEAVKRFVSSDNKRSVPSEDGSVVLAKSPFADPENQVDDEMVF